MVPCSLKPDYKWKSRCIQQESFCHPTATIGMVLNEKKQCAAPSKVKPSPYTKPSFSSAPSETPNANLLQKALAQQNQSLWNTAQWHCHFILACTELNIHTYETWLALLKCFFPVKTNHAMLHKSTVLSHRFLHYPPCNTIFCFNTSPIFPIIFGLQHLVLQKTHYENFQDLHYFPALSIYIQNFHHRPKGTNRIYTTEESYICFEKIWIGFPFSA